MAEKIFTNVRLGLKVDTLENWGKSSLILKKGEVAFATVAASEGVGLTDPVCMMKIGDGEHTFSELKFDFYAKASDVLEAAKDAEKLTAFINNVIAGSGMATDEAMKALTTRVTTAEGDIDKLENALDGETGLKARMTAVEAKAALVGDEAVATQIATAINGLNIADYAKKTEVGAVETALNTYKTSNDAAVKKVSDDLAAEISRAGLAEKANADAIALIKDSETIDSFADVETELGKKEAAGEAAKAQAAAQAYADGLAKNYDATGSAAAAQAAAQAYADGLASNYDAAGTAAQALEDAKDYTDAEILEWVGDKSVTAQIAALDLANTYDAKGAAAAAETAAKAHATGLNTAMNTRVEALEAIDHDHANAAELAKIADGDVAKWNAAEQNAKNYADGLDEAMDARVLALEGKFGDGEGNVEAQIAAAVKEEADRAKGIEGGLETRLAAVEADYLVEADKTELAGDIADLAALIGDKGTVQEQISAAVEAEAKIARAAEKANADAIKAIADDYLVEADKTEIIGAIATAKQEAIATVLGEGTDEDFDTLKEVADWILSDTTGAAALQTDVAAIKADYLKAADKTELEGKITAAQNAANKAQGEVDALEEVVATKAAASDLTTLAGRVTTVEGDLNAETTGLKARMTTAEGEIDAIQGVIGEVKSVADYVTGEISAAITAENLGQYAKAADLNTANGKIEALEGKAHTHANAEELAKFVDGDKAKLDTAVQTITAGAGLKATKTGTDVAIAFDDSITFIFDCGGADVE